MKYLLIILVCVSLPGCLSGKSAPKSDAKAEMAAAVAGALAVITKPAPAITPRSDAESDSGPFKATFYCDHCHIMFNCESYVPESDVVHCQKCGGPCRRQ